MDFRLLRLILIDSYSPGRVVEFPMEGGAVLTGRNGRGKTTLLQLVPIFYGENPTRIVGTETNRLDFNGYYLPRLTSYIVFEYLRRDYLCMVLLHASQQGGERRYRFVRSPYRADFFLLPDGINILQAPDLRRHFKLKGVIHSEAIAVRQRVPRHHPGQGRQRQGLAAPARPGRRTTPVSAAAITSPTSRRSSAACSCAARTSRTSSGWWCPASRTHDAEIALSTERRKIASWPEQYGAYTRAMDEAGRMAEILDREARLGAVEAELGRHPRPGAAPARAS